MVFPSFSKSFSLLFVLIIAVSACQFGSSPWHKPNSKANHTIVIGVESCTQNDGENPLAIMQQQLTEKLEAAHVFYQSISADPAKQELTFNIIGHEDPNEKGDFKTVLLKQPILKMITAVRLQDQGVKSWMDTVIIRDNLQSSLNVNSGVYQRAVLGFCSKTNFNQINKAFKKYENEAPFNIHFGDFRAMQHGGEQFPEIAIYASRKRDQNFLSNTDVVDASVAPNSQTGEIDVAVSLNGKGAKKWADMTTAAANNGRREILILLDEEVVSAPTVNDPILGGRSFISNNFNWTEAGLIAVSLRNGIPPCQIKIK